MTLRVWHQTDVALPFISWVSFRKSLTPLGLTLAVKGVNSFDVGELLGALNECMSGVRDRVSAQKMVGIHLTVPSDVRAYVPCSATGLTVKPRTEPTQFL